MSAPRWQKTLCRRLHLLGYASYEAYLQSSWWASVRKRYMQSELPKTCFCGEEDVNLHHRTYRRLGAEWTTDLVPMCRLHHQLFHKHLEFYGTGSLAQVTDGFIRDCSGLFENRSIKKEKKENKEEKTGKCLYCSAIEKKRTNFSEEKRKKDKKEKRRGFPKGVFLRLCQANSLPQYVFLFYTTLEFTDWADVLILYGLYGQA